MARKETWISVDIETSGQSPSTGSLISLGACLVDRPEASFYMEIKPLPDRPWGVVEEGIHGLSRGYLAAHGRKPVVAMGDLRDWIAGLPEVQAGARPIFVGFNATFDFAFVHDWFQQFGAGSRPDPFGISGLDIKALALGLGYPEWDRWAQTSKPFLRALHPNPPGFAHTHNALDDAREQAELLRWLLASGRQKTQGAPFAHS